MPDEADISERLRRVREELSQMELPDLPDEEVDERARTLAENVAKASASARFPEPPELTIPPSRERRKEKEKQMIKDGESMRGLGVGMQIAYIIIGVPAIGLGVGAALEKWMHVPNAIAFGTIAGAIVGVLLAVRISNMLDRP